MAADKFSKSSAEKLFKLLEDADLSDEEKQAVEQTIKYASLTENQELLSAIGCALLLRKSSEYDAFKRYENTPKLNPYWHSLIVGAPGTGKTVFANIQIVRIVKEYMT